MVAVTQAAVSTTCTDPELLFWIVPSHAVRRRLDHEHVLRRVGVPAAADHLLARRAAAAVGLVVLMAGALAFRLRVRDSAGFLIGDAALLSLAAATASLLIA